MYSNLISVRTLGHKISIDIVTAYLFIQLQELIDADRAAIDRRETVLQPHVVLRLARKSRLRITTVDVGAHLLHRAADTLRVPDRIVDLAVIAHGTALGVGRCQ